MVLLSRRHFFTMLSATAWAQPRGLPLEPPRVRTGPLLCLDSKLTPEIEYSMLGTVINGLGFDGCDLSVEKGGTVDPAQSPVDLVRAIEVITGSGIELPVITTSFLSVVEPWARNVLALAGRSGVPLFRAGYSRRPSPSLVAHRGDIASLAAYGRAAGIALGLPYPGAEAVASDFDPAWVGYDLDTARAEETRWETVLPRVRMVTLRDARRENDELMACPLGEGVVDWPAFFSALIRARFSGPLTIRIEYPAPDRLQAIRRDLEFARKQLDAAYQKQSGFSAR